MRQVSEFVVHTHLQARKDPTQRSLEARLRNARYLAELTKFRLAPFGTFFSLLKSLLDDFVGHNIDAAAALVETAGRFLYRLPETQTRISNMLEVCEVCCHLWQYLYCFQALVVGSPLCLYCQFWCQKVPCHGCGLWRRLAWLQS